MQDLQSILWDYSACRDFPSLQRALNAFRDGGFEKPAGAGYPSRKILILSNYSTQFIAAALHLGLLQNGMWPEIRADEFNSWEITPLRNDGALESFKPDVVLFLLSSLPLAFG